MPRPEPFVAHVDDCEVERWQDPARGPVQWRTLISGDRTPTDSLTVGIAEVPAGAPDPRLHRHAQAEVYHVLAGEGMVTIDGRDFALRAGSTAFIPGDALHGARNTGAEPLRILYVFASGSFDEIDYRFPSQPGIRAPSGRHRP